MSNLPKQLREETESESWDCYPKDDILGLEDVQIIARGAFSRGAEWLFSRLIADQEIKFDRQAIYDNVVEKWREYWFGKLLILTIS